MDWKMLIVLLGGMVLGAGGMALLRRRHQPQAAGIWPCWPIGWNSCRQMGNTPL